MDNGRNQTPIPASPLPKAMKIRNFWDSGFGWNAEYDPSQYDKKGNVLGWEKVVPKWLDKWLDKVHELTAPKTD